MNFLKSIFITLASIIWMVATIHFSQLLFQEQKLIYVVNAVVHVIPLLFLLNLFRYKTPRTSRQLWPISLIIAFAWFWTFIHYYENRNEVSNFLFTTLGAGLWMIYLTWYSKLGKREKPDLKPGKMIPELYFINVDGQKISNYDGDASFTIYLFYRGNWCPLCMAQIREISHQYQHLHGLGARVALISGQRMSYIKNLAAKMDVDFNYWQDNNNEVARQLGIDHSFGTPMGFQLLGYKSETVLPTLIVTDHKGEILFSDQTDNYRVRPEPKTFIRIIQSYINRNKSMSA